MPLLKSENRTLKETKKGPDKSGPFFIHFVVLFI